MPSQDFEKKIARRVDVSNSLLCIGLDPHVGELPQASAEAALEFCMRIVQNTHQFACAYKPNSAFFEYFGAAGMDALTKLVGAIPRDIPVILDCKRGDIGSTAQAYAAASYSIYRADAVTLSPYMGWDSVEPFVTGEYCKRGAFVLCKTSNPSSQELQMVQTTEGSKIFEQVASLCEQWRGKGHQIGLVAGATDLPALERVRALCPQAWILCPGVGAQGGSAEEVCKVALREDQSGLLVSVSRAISGAADMGAKAKSLRDEINTVRDLLRSRKRARPSDLPATATATTATTTTIAPPTTAAAAASHSGVGAGSSKSEAGLHLSEHQREFIETALEKKALLFGTFKLKSGRQSPYFFNAGNFSCGMSLARVSRCYARAIKASGIEFDVMFGPAYKGIPFATALAVAWFDLFGEVSEVSYNRKEAKDHGEGGVLVGAAVSGRRVLIVDDVITAGTAIRESMTLLSASGAQTVAVAVCLDRQEKAAEGSALSAIQLVEQEFKIPVVSVVRLQHLVAFLRGSADAQQLDAIEEYRAQFGVEY